MDWLPPIEVSRISDGGKVRPQKELFLIQSDYSIWFILLRKREGERDLSAGCVPGGGEWTYGGNAPGVLTGSVRNRVTKSRDQNKWEFA